MRVFLNNSSNNESIYQAAMVTTSSWNFFHVLIMLPKSILILVELFLFGYAFVTRCDLPRGKLNPLQSALTWILGYFDFRIYYQHGKTGICIELEY